MADGDNVNGGAVLQISSSSQAFVLRRSYGRKALSGLPGDPPQRGVRRESESPVTVSTQPGKRDQCATRWARGSSGASGHGGSV